MRNTSKNRAFFCMMFFVDRSQTYICFCKVVIILNFHYAMDSLYNYCQGGQCILYINVP